VIDALLLLALGLGPRMQEGIDNTVAHCERSGVVRVDVGCDFTCLAERIGELRFDRLARLGFLAVAPGWCQRQAFSLPRRGHLRLPTFNSRPYRSPIPKFHPSPLFSANHARAQLNIQTCVLDNPRFTRPIYYKLRGAGLVPSVHVSLAGSREARALRGASIRATGASLMQDRLGRMSLRTPA